MLEYQKRDEGLRHYHRGLTLERANRLAEAVEEYRLAVAICPHLREAHAALGFYYQRAGLLAKAADQFQRVVSLGGDFLAYFNLGYVLIELERFDDALVALQACLHLEPQDSATHFEVAFVYYARNNFSTALEHLRQALVSYPDDWEIHQLMGKCHLGLRQYDEALTAFANALLLAPDPQFQTDLLEHMAAVERYREFRSLNNAKDEMYAHDGTVYIGSAQDNGLTLAEATDYHFTYPDIGVTVQRLLALWRGTEWQFTAVVAVDVVARPLAAALGDLLNVPLRTMAALQPDDSALLVLAVAREVELLDVTAERTPCPSVTFCLGLNWLRHSRALPNIVGIAARGACSVPWEAEVRRMRADGAPPTQVHACIEQATRRIVEAVQAVPHERNLSRQVRYYTRTHRRLSFSNLQPEDTIG